MREHGAQVRAVEVQEGDEGKALTVELLRQVRRRVEGGEHVIHAGELLPGDVAPSTEASAHLVEMAADPLHRRLEAVEQRRQLGGVCDEARAAEGLERLLVAIGGGPPAGALPDASLDPGAVGLAVQRDQRADRGRGIDRGGR